ncbi:putative Ig domain-containing protein [Streptomyces sp. NPDC047981]|uniref:golvesin C-terminal-like domain-containing protein n=1 Tax=Streptomyces sp. NPDC047981 TaxID=3154610 RepID=UPI003441A37E
MPRSGTFGVYYWLPDGNASRVTDARFTVHHEDGSSAYRVDQRSAQGGRWILLGNHTFAQGGTAYVEVAASASGTVNADAVKLGAPGQETIETQVARAVAAGDKQVTIQPGVYRRSSTLSLGSLSGFTVRAHGVTIIQTRLMTALSTGKASNLTIEGLTINYDPLPFTQGRVIEVAPDGSSWMDVEISKGYPRPGKLNDRVTIFDPSTRLPSSQTLGAKVSWKDAAAGIARSSNAWSADIGDIVTFAGGATAGASFGITVDGANTTFRDVRLHAAPGMGFFNASGDGNTHLDGFHIVPGPPPPGATEQPILTSTWDAMQFQSVKKGPTIENSTVVNAGDDSMSIQGIGGLKIVKAQDSTIWVEFSDTYHMARTGDRIQQWADGPVATVKSLVQETDPAVRSLGSNPANVYRLDLDRTSPWSASSTVTDIDRMGNGFVFRNNRIDSSGRGLLLKARDGVIENNWMRGSNSISVSTEAWSGSHMNAGGDLVIKGNTFVSATWSGGGPWDSCQVGAVSFEGGSPRKLYPKITIEGNVFKDIRGLNLQLSQVSDATVRNNRFEGSQQLSYSATSNRCSIPRTSVVHVRESERVVFEGNTIDRIGPYMVRTATVDTKTTTGITGLPDGVKVGNTYLSVNPDSVYSAANRGTSEALSAMQGSATEAPAKPAPPAPTTAQGWTFVPTGSGSVRIKSGLTGLVLAAGPGTSVSQRPQSDDPAQLWQLLDSSKETVKILNTATGSMLGATAASATTPPRLTLAQPSGTLAQNWRITDVSLRWTADSPPPSAARGRSYSHTFAAVGTPPARYTVTSGSLPAGLTLDPATGVLRGIPTKAGTYTFVVTADNGYVAKASGTRTVRVGDPWAPTFLDDWLKPGAPLRELIEQQRRNVRCR